jgi:hypothetical protein
MGHRTLVTCVDPAVASSSDSGWRRWGEAVAVAASTYFAGLTQRHRILFSLRNVAVESLEVLAGQEPVRNFTGAATGTAGKYSNRCGSEQTRAYALGR